MDFNVDTTTLNQLDYSWLYNHQGLVRLSATLDTSHLVLATHFPDGFVKPGMALGQFTASPNLFTPWVQDGGAGGNGAGEETLTALVYSGFKVRRDAAGAIISGRTTGTVLLPSPGTIIIPGKLPAGLLTNGSTANTPTASELSALGFSVPTL